MLYLFMAPGHSFTCMCLASQICWNCEPYTRQRRETPWSSAWDQRQSRSRSGYIRSSMYDVIHKSFSEIFFNDFEFRFLKGHQM